MKLSLREAAETLGKSERQVRYLIQNGGLPAQKIDGRWRIERDDLRLKAGATQARQRKRERAAEIADQVLRQDAPPKRRYSATDLKAFEAARALYGDLAALGQDHPVAGIVLETLVQLSCGCHAFHAQHKAAYFAKARERACHASVLLLLEENGGPLAERLEQDVIPAIGGLIRRAERRPK